MQKKRIAVIVASNIYNRKGLFYAAHERIKRLLKNESYEVVPFVISRYYPWYVRLLNRKKKVEKPKEFLVDGINYHILWIRRTIKDFIRMHKLKRPPKDAYVEFLKYISCFKDFDLIITHSCAEYGYIINKGADIPYIATWHGSDIHTLGFLSPSYTKETKMSIEAASHNFFVSKDLLSKSNKITQSLNKSVSYNGKDSKFYEYNEDVRLELKNKWSAKDDVVIFIGNLIPVKNIKVLPSIFNYIHQKRENVSFWIVGDGALRTELERNTKGLPIKFWGNIDHDMIPKLLNVASVLVLPSLNEGLPLTTVEALGCGCNVVGSRVGGIAEAIGVENTFPLDAPNFEKDFAARCLYFLENNIVPSLSEVFDWNKCVDSEMIIINELINKQITSKKQ